MKNDNIVLFSAYAKLPEGTVSSELYKVMALVLLIDTKTGQIAEVDCTLSTRAAERFVSELLTGKNINDLEQLTNILRNRYQGSAKNALLSALRSIKDKYVRFINTAAPDNTRG